MGDDVQQLHLATHLTVSILQIIYLEVDHVAPGVPGRVVPLYRSLVVLPGEPSDGVDLSSEDDGGKVRSFVQHRSDGGPLVPGKFVDLGTPQPLNGPNRLIIQL